MSLIEQSKQLKAACESGDFSTVQKLATSLYSSTSPSSDIIPISVPMICAAAGGHIAIVKFFFDSSPFCQPPLAWKSYFPGWPASWDPAWTDYEFYYGDPMRIVVAAVQSGSTELVQFFIDRGADVDKEPERDFPPLSYALKRRDWPMADLLIAHGATPNCPFTRLKGEVFLSKAGAEGDVELMDFLVVKHHVSIHQSGALTGAAEQGNIKGGEHALQLGADANELYLWPTLHPETKSSLHRTALHAAVNNNQIAFVRFLMEHGANPERRDGSGQTVVEFAREVGNRDECLLALKGGKA